MCIHLRHKMELAPWGFNAEFVPLKWFILLRRKIYFSCKSGFYINYNEILEMTSFFIKRLSEYNGYSSRLIIESSKGRKFESQHVKLGGWFFTLLILKFYCPVWPDWAIFALWATFQSMWQQLYCPNLRHSQAGVKIFHFSVGFIFGQHY